MTVQAFVTKISSKSGTSNSTGKPYTLYSAKLADREGNELDGWYGIGFYPPKFNEGDFIQFEVTQRGQYKNIDTKSVKVSSNPPPVPTVTPSATAPAAARSTGKVSELFGEIGGYNTEDDIRRMSYSAARDHAIRTVALLLENKAISLSQSGPKRFEVITSTIDKLTSEYFYDSATGRKIGERADDAASPEPTPAVVDGFEAESDDEFADEIPF